MPAKRKSKYKKTQREYAEIYERDVRTIREWQKKKYPLDDPEAMEAKLAEQLHQGGKDASDDDERIDAAALTDEQLESPGNAYEAKLYESILRCRKLAHALREAKRLVIPRDEIKAALVKANSVIRSRVLAIQGEMPGRLAGKAEVDIQQVLADWCHETLSFLANPDNLA